MIRQRLQAAGWLAAALLALVLGLAPAMAQDGGAPDPAAPEAPAPAAAPEPAAPAPDTSEAAGPAAPSAPGAALTEAAGPAPEAAPAPGGATAPAAPQPAAPESGASPTVVERISDGLAGLLPGEVATRITEQLTTERRDDLPHDLSPWGMFMAADRVVKAVMIGLAIASVLTWTIWFAKTLQIAGARARARATLARIQRSASMAEAEAALGKRGGPAAAMLAAAADEFRRSEPAIDLIGGAGLRERTALALARIEAQAGRRLSKGTGVLATIGSTAPFVGLFGTVWGIMNSFIGISEAQTTNLAIVAPGIAEALLATGLGLVAAIPAVVIYNMFARAIAGYRQILGDTAAAVERLLSRDLDFRAAALVGGQAEDAPMQAAAE